MALVKLTAAGGTYLEVFDAMTERYIVDKFMANCGRLQTDTHKATPIFLFDLLFSAPGPPPLGFVGVQGPAGKDDTACFKEVMDYFAGKDELPQANKEANKDAMHAKFTDTGNATLENIRLDVPANTAAEQYRHCKVEECKDMIEESVRALSALVLSSQEQCKTLVEQLKDQAKETNDLKQTVKEQSAKLDLLANTAADQY